MKKKTLLGILIILVVVLATFVRVDATDVNQITKETNTTVEEVKKDDSNVVESVGNTASNSVETEKEVAKQEAQNVLSVPKDDLIYSNKFLVKGKTISRIDPKTSIEEFRKNIEVTKGKEVKIYKGEKEVTSGYIATGMLVKSEDGQEYTTSVTGDILGDGVPNQVELTMIIRHIIDLQDWKLEGIEKSSADITGDGKVDLVDINKLINYIVYQKWEGEEIKTPNAPTINVITKKDENKDYYIGEVEIKIEEDKTTKNARTTYIITGSKEQKETEIKEGEKITLTEPGEYLITAYTYGIKGNKSKGANKVIKVIGRVPNLTAGNTIITYTPTSWTNGPVTVSIQTKIEGYILQYSKDEVKWEDYTKEIEMTQNGKIYARLRDNLGNAGGKIIGSIGNIDKLLPTVTLTPNGGERYTMPTTGNAKINTIITATDAEKTDVNGCSGLNTLQYAWSQSKDVEPETWADFTNGSKVEKTDIAEPGTWYLWTKVIDKAGNRAENIKVSNPFIVKSNEDPANQITLAQNPKAWTNGNVTVAVGFGANLVQNKTLICSGTVGTDYVVNGLESVVVKTNGKTVTAVAQDIAGNTVGKELKINNIDKTLPVINDLIADPAPCANRNVTVTAKASDTQSGIVAYQFSQDGNLTASSNGWTNITGGAAEITQTKEVAATGIWYFYAKDAVGNVSKKQIAIIIDKTPPTVKIPSSAIGGNTISVKASDVGSGVGYWAYGESSSAPETWTQIERSNDVTIPVTAPSVTKDTTYYIFVKDLAGNVSSASIEVTPARWNNARVKTNYTTLEKALLGANSGDTLTLLSDYNDSSEATISSGKTITLNTNGKTVTKSINTIRIDSGGTLNINGTGTMKSVTSDISLFLNCGTLNINEGTISTDYNIIWNQGDLNISGGTLTGGTGGSSWPGIIVDMGSATITGGTISCGAAAIELRGNANITITGENTVIRGGTSSDSSAIYCTSSSSGTINIGTTSSTNTNYPHIIGIDNQSTNVIVNKYSGKIN